MPGINLDTVMNGPIANGLVVMGIVFLLVTLLIVTRFLPVLRDLALAMNNLSNAVNGMQEKISIQNEKMEDLQTGFGRLEGRRFNIQSLGTVAAMVALAGWVIGRRG